MTGTERAVLTAYKTEDESDPEGGFAPYYHTIAAAAGGDIDVAYAACKSLKKAGLLTCNGRQAAAVISAPSYWITDEGKVAA